MRYNRLTTMYTSETVTKAENQVTLDTVIEAFLARQLDNAATMSPYYQDLWAEVARLIRSGGKRLRSRMVVLSYSMFGGKDVEAILPAAAAQELLHLGMLIHDDIIDRDYIRYGVDNIAGGYNKLYDELVSDKTDRLHYAHSAALLAGDLMISEAYLLMADSKVDARKILDIQKLLGQSIFEVIGGELLDTESAFREIGAVTPEIVALYKTASYTFTMPMLVGAQLANVSTDDQVHVRTFGRNLGIAFQLRDDIIGVFGNEAETGKTTTGDIREGKRTFMIEQFYALATEEQRTVFDRYFGDHSISTEEVATIRELIAASGALEKTEQAIAGYEARAREALKELKVDAAYSEQINDLILVATKRAK